MKKQSLYDYMLSSEDVSTKELIKEGSKIINEYNRKMSKKSGQEGGKKIKLTKKEREERQKWKSVWHDKYYKKKW